MNELASPRENFKSKIKRAFARADSNRSGTLEEEGLRLVLQIITKSLNEDDIYRIFEHLEAYDSGFVELQHVEEFLLQPPHSRDVIRLDMSKYLSQPDRFSKYRTWEVEGRPFNFRLGSGANNISAYFVDSSVSDMVRLVKKGSKLAFINTARVDYLSYYDIVDVLSLISCPFKLTFYTQDISDGALGFNGELKFSKNLPDKLDVQEQKLVQRPYISMRNPELVKQLYLESLLSPHCEHCPLEDSRWIGVHRFMEDETFSEGSWYLSNTITLLIALSTASYILSTEVSLENWAGWQNIEAVLSILFSIEFGVRLASCRSIFSYMGDIWNVIDFCAVAPFWIEIVSGGALEASTLRIVRSVRLFRLLRLSKTGTIAEAIEICKSTIIHSFHYMLALTLLGLLLIVIFGTFAWLFENGEPNIFTDCDVMARNMTCSFQNDSSLIWSNSNVSSFDACEAECEVNDLGRCCSFDQRTGDCELWNSTSLDYIGDLSKSASLCNVKKLRLRPNEDTASPFNSILQGLWYICVTMTMVGYGEMSTTTPAGKFISLVCTQIGVIFVACPIIIIGFHFSVAVYRLQIKKVIVFFKKEGKASVNLILEQANAVFEMELFKEEEELTMLKNRINSDEKLKQLLSFNTGWNYLPHAEEHNPGLPRISQYKLFLLYAIFGRSFQRNQKAISKRGIKFQKDLDLIMPKFGSTRSVRDITMASFSSTRSIFGQSPRSSSLQRIPDSSLKRAQSVPGSARVSQYSPSSSQNSPRSKTNRRSPRKLQKYGYQPLLKPHLSSPIIKSDIAK